MTPITELSHTLWRQRRLMELLAYRLEMQQLVLASGRTKWLTNAANEVEEVLNALRQEELGRAVQVTAIGRLLKLGPEPTLAEIVQAAPAPWDEILREHQQAFLAMTAEIEQISRHNRDLLQRGQQATRELLAAIAGDDDAVEGYSSAGTGQRIGGGPARTLDWSA